METAKGISLVEAYRGHNIYQHDFCGSKFSFVKYKPTGKTVATKSFMSLKKIKAIIDKDF